MIGLVSLIVLAMWNPPQVAAIIAFLSICAILVLIVARIVRTGFFRALGIWLVSQLAGVPIWILCVLVVRPHLFEAFYMPTNSMAPTILGEHLSGVCARCGSRAYCSPLDPDEMRGPVQLHGICTQEMTSCAMKDASTVVTRGDRVFVNKNLTPRRWDLVAFRAIHDNSTIYIKRLVGLPGEEIMIHDGAAWANGNKLVPPVEVSRLHYVDKMQGWGPPLWGSEERPAKLGDDEYFVLGDNSSSSKDSRLWEEGAEGHPPYALPGDHIVGVVTHIYWPLSRYRVFR